MLPFSTSIRCAIFSNQATASISNFSLFQRRSLHVTPFGQYHYYDFYNKHKTVTDPARQDPDYFEKEAEKLPLTSERYITELKNLWEEKIGSERELIFKAQDRLIGNVAYKSDFGLPKVDLSKPRWDYRGIDALQNAPEAVKKIFSVAHGNGGDYSREWKHELMRKVRRDDLDGSSLAAKIGWATAVIRNWNRLYAEHDVQRQKLILGRMRPRATWISHPLYLLINHRRKMLRKLRESNEEEFKRVINELQISYHVGKQPEHVKTRKAWSEAQLKRRVELEKERQLEELHQKLIEGREEKAQQIDQELAAINKEEQEILAQLHQMDIDEGKTVANIVGKYMPDYIGEMREISNNGRIFFNNP